MKDPEEIELIIEILYSLKENIRRKILDIIFSAEVEGISFKSIVNKGHIPPTTVAYHLKVLVKAGLVENVFLNIDGRRDYSFYRSTTRGDRAFILMNEIYGSLGPSADQDEGLSLPDIHIIPLRLGPRCLNIERIRG